VNNGFKAAELARLVATLPPKERRGSRPRCVLLTHARGDLVASRLGALAGPDAVVDQEDSWFPRGFADPREITLGDCDERVLARSDQEALARWWLATMGTLPTWDLVSTARTGDAKALLLVEAKAHTNELIETPRRPRSRANQARISAALEEASTALEAVMPGWDLPRAPYQLANRVAWAWRLATMGVPVVLAYVGFLHATEMHDRGNWFVERAEWERTMHAYANEVVPEGAWGTRIPVGAAWIQLRMCIAHVPLPRPCPLCGAQLRWIVYGMPSDSIAAAMESGEYELGGCVVSEDAPDHRCGQCGAPFRLEQWGRVGTAT
jgi:hypothetical protein